MASDPVSSNDKSYQSYRSRLFLWIQRNSPPVMRRAPTVYLVTILLLLCGGAVSLIRINFASAAVLAQAAQSAQQAATPTPAAGTIQSRVPATPAQPAPGTGSPSGPAKFADTVTPEELKDRIDDFKWVLTLILGVAGLFTVVQGVAASFSAQNFQKQADGIFANLEKLAAETKARYPIFSDTEDRRTLAYEKLTQDLKKTSAIGSADEGLDWRRQFYESMEVADRQEILSFERFVGYEYASQSEPRETFAAQLRRLAHFYWSKYICEQNYGLGSAADLERAEYLLILAMRKIGEQFYLYNDLGNVRLEVLKARKRMLGSNPSSDAVREMIASAKAIKKDFDESRQLNREQIRAYYNLAWIDAEFLNNLDGAIVWLKQGVQFPNWETRPVSDFKCRAFFNLACFLGRKAKESSSSAPSQEMLAALYQAASIGATSAKDVEQEYGPEGDFNYLMAHGDATTQNVLISLKPQLSAHAG